MDPLSGNLRAYDFTLTSLKQSADREGQVTKQLAKDDGGNKVAPPSKGAAPTAAAPVASTGTLGQKLDITA